MPGSMVGFNAAGESYRNEIGLGGCKACSMNGGDAKKKKRKLSAYNRFMKTEMLKLKKAYPSKQAPEIMKMAAKNWRDSKKK